MPNLDTNGEVFARFIEFLRKAQEEAANLAHLENNYKSNKSEAWLAVSENLKKMQGIVTQLAMKAMN